MVDKMHVERNMVLKVHRLGYAGASEKTGRVAIDFAPC